MPCASFKICSFVGNALPVPLDEVLETPLEICNRDGAECASDSCLDIFQILEFVSMDLFLEHWECPKITWTEVWWIWRVLPNRLLNKLQEIFSVISRVRWCIVMQENEAVWWTPKCRSLFSHCLPHPTKRLNVHIPRDHSIIIKVCQNDTRTVKKQDEHCLLLGSRSQDLGWAWFLFRSPLHVSTFGQRVKSVNPTFIRCHNAVDESWVTLQLGQIPLWEHHSAILFLLRQYTRHKFGCNLRHAKVLLEDFPDRGVCHFSLSGKLAQGWASICLKLGLHFVNSCRSPLAFWSTSPFGIRCGLPWVSSEHSEPVTNLGVAKGVVPKSCLHWINCALRVKPPSHTWLNDYPLLTTTFQSGTKTNKNEQTCEYRHCAASNWHKTTGNKVKLATVWPKKTLDHCAPGKDQETKKRKPKLSRLHPKKRTLRKYKIQASYEHDLVRVRNSRRAHPGPQHNNNIILPSKDPRNSFIKSKKHFNQSLAKKIQVEDITCFFECSGGIPLVQRIVPFAFSWGGSLTLVELTLRADSRTCVLPARSPRRAEENLWTSACESRTEVGTTSPTPPKRLVLDPSFSTDPPRGFLDCSVRKWTSIFVSTFLLASNVDSHQTICFSQRFAAVSVQTTFLSNVASTKYARIIDWHTWDSHQHSTQADPGKDNSVWIQFVAPVHPHSREKSSSLCTFLNILWLVESACEESQQELRSHLIVNDHQRHLQIDHFGFHKFCRPKRTTVGALNDQVWTVKSTDFSQVPKGFLGAHWTWSNSKSFERISLSPKNVSILSRWTKDNNASLVFIHEQSCQSRVHWRQFYFTRPFATSLFARQRTIFSQPAPRLFPALVFISAATRFWKRRVLKSLGT